MKEPPGRQGFYHPFRSTEGSVFRDQLRNYQLLNKKPAP
jgi:hypothetical protein